MSATRLPSFAPPNALLIWRDNHNIYIEIPGPSAEATIISYRLSEGGLSKALSLLQSPPDTAGKPQTTINPTRPLKRVGTTVQHTLAEAILRRRGILK